MGWDEDGVCSDWTKWPTKVGRRSVRFKLGVRRPAGCASSEFGVRCSELTEMALKRTFAKVIVKMPSQIP